MAKMIITIELGNDAMQTGEDVIQSIKSSLEGEEGLILDEGVGGRLWDVNGNITGSWTVTQ